MAKKSLNIQLYTRNSSQLGLGSPNTREKNPGICAEETNGQYPEKKQEQDNNTVNQFH